MTTTENDLRDALRLLEQRAPEELPDAPPRSVARRIPRAAVIASAAAVVLVVGGLASFLGLHHNHMRPPAEQHDGLSVSGTPTTPPTAALGTLQVRVALSGARLRHNGAITPLNRPEPDATVTVTGVQAGAGAYHSRLRVSATTTRRGIAIFALPPGRYRYRSDTCGSGSPPRRSVMIRPVRTVTVQIICVVR